jgi:hypothetical protein
MGDAAGFAVPFARDGIGRLVGPDEAIPRGVYRCPSCDQTVDLHAGVRKRRHFHHRGSATCTPESVAHRTAKQLIVACIQRWQEGEAPPRFLRRCAFDGCERTALQPLPAKVRQAVEEMRLPSGRVVDVALLGTGGLTIAAIEVRQSHAVDADKARALPLPWIEVDAAQVCATGGARLEPTQDRFLRWYCDQHAGTRREAARATLREPRRRKALVRRLPFRMEDYPGFRVDQLVACSAGHDAFVFAWEGSEPPWPRPPLVVAHESDGDWRYGRGDKLRRVLPFRRKYVSVCPVCGQAVSADPADGGT